MSRDEAKQIVMIIKTAYPNWKPDDLSVAVNAWATIFRDYAYKDVESGLTAYITTDTTGFAPSMGQVIAKIHIAEEYSELNEMSAWALVSKALRNGYYGSEKEFEALPELVQKAVGSPSNLKNWSMTDSQSVENVIQSNFLRSYRAVLQRAKEFSKLPTEMRNAINANEQTAIEDKNQFNKFEKRSYDFDELEKELTDN